jgi:hypothetical protein
MRVLTFLLVAVLSAGCASGPVVRTDRDPAVELTRYQAYAWKQPPPISNPLLKQRVVDAIDAELARKGWRQVQEPAAQVLLVANVSAREEQTIAAFYDGPDWNDWGWRGPWPRGPRHVEVSTYTVGTLVLDMFDANTRRAVWRATAEGTVPSSQARIDADAMAAVRGMFADFPPSGQPTP